jgi:hypothetical protein
VAQARLSMRKIREVLRLQAEGSGFGPRLLGASATRSQSGPVEQNGGNPHDGRADGRAIARLG